MLYNIYNLFYTTIIHCRPHRLMVVAQIVNRSTYFLIGAIPLEPEETHKSDQAITF
jgi:hypothetical protein